MKKIICIGMLILITLTMLVGCGDSISASDGVIRFNDEEWYMVEIPFGIGMEDIYYHADADPTSSYGLYQYDIDNATFTNIYDDYWVVYDEYQDVCMFLRGTEDSIDMQGASQIFSDNKDIAIDFAEAIEKFPIPAPQKLFWEMESVENSNMEMIPEEEMDAFTQETIYEPDYANGNCGKDLYWSLSVDGLLRVSGSGDMYDFSYDDTVPWDEFRDLIYGVVIESGATSIGRYAFYECDNLTSVELSDTIVKMELSAFQSCDLLEYVDLPDGIKELPKQAFSNCIALKNIDLPKNLEMIQDYAFSGCESLEEVSMPSEVWYVGNDVFEECRGLKTVKMSAKIRALGSEAFAFCESLESITIPSGITNLSNTFFKCSSLETVYFEGDAPSISNRAFSEVTATCYYPSGNRTWTVSKMSDYEGKLTWQAN